jgi:hypothetical protein
VASFRLARAALSSTLAEQRRGRSPPVVRWVSRMHGRAHDLEESRCAAGAPEYKSTLSLIRTSCFLEREGRQVQAKYVSDDFMVFWRILPLSGMKPNWLKKPCCRETVILAH